MIRKIREKKNKLRRRAYHIIMSDRNKDEIKRTNRTLNKINNSFSSLHKALKKCNDAFSNVVKNINNNIFRGHPNTIL